MKRLSVNVPPDLHREAKLLAHLEDETLSSLVLRLLRQHVKTANVHYSEMMGRRGANAGWESRSVQGL
jgi:hypothetical protein